jgi:hypothetical protein
MEGAIRRLTADELLAGRPLPLRWKVQISDSDDVVQLTIAFATIVLGEHTGTLRFRAVSHPEVIEAAKEIVGRASGANAGIATGLKELRTQLKVLGQINTALRPR